MRFNELSEKKSLSQNSFHHSFVIPWWKISIFTHNLDEYLDVYQRFFSTYTGILAVVLLLLIGLAFILGRYFTRHKGDYQTNEAKDAQLFDDPDYAVAAGKTGQPDVQKKKEWYI